MNKPPLSPNAIVAINLLGAILGIDPCTDPNCEACRAGDDKPVSPEVQKERWRLDAIEMDARDAIEDRVIEVLHRALFDSKHALVDIEHTTHQPFKNNNPEVHRARVAYAEHLLALFTAKREARNGARPKQATEGVSQVGPETAQQRA